jgi:molybdopterin-guanine dinucleotide biosynthesis protein A
VKTAFSGAVLTGGASTRMGEDKAFIEIRGRPLVRIAADALLAAGASDVHAIGGDVQRLGRLGLAAHPDRNPGAGPLDGLVQALHIAAHDVVVVLACDQPNIDAALVERLRSGVTSPYDAVVPVTDDVVQPLAAAYSRRAATALGAAFDEGERSPSRALDRLRWRALDDVPSDALLDLDDPDDLARYAANDPTTNHRG